MQYRDRGRCTRCDQPFDDHAIEVRQRTKETFLFCTAEVDWCDPNDDGEYHGERDSDSYSRLWRPDEGCSFYHRVLDGGDTFSPGRVKLVLYWTDRFYGGPEEGGWWYGVGEVAAVITLRNNPFEVQLAKQMLRDLHHLNGERESDDGYRFAVYDSDYEPKGYPQRRPIYS